jgi:uncharacterized small protein (DUF1192 family)
VTYCRLVEAMEEADLRAAADDLRKKISKKYKSAFQNCKSSYQDYTGKESSSITLDETSKKIKEVVESYRNGNDICLPSNPELEGKYDNVMADLRRHLSSAKPESLQHIHTQFCNVYQRMEFGIRPADISDVPETGPGLYKFVATKFTPYELFLLHDAFMEMENADLQAKFKEYESVLSSHLTEKMTSCALRKVSLPMGGNHTHMAIAVSKEQVLIALVIHLREYFYYYLSLQDLIFQGFQEGCMIVYFSITLHDAAFLAPKILSHLAELKSRFNVTHVIVFGHFTADVDGCRVELLPQIKEESTSKEGNTATSDTPHIVKDKLKKLEDAEICLEQVKHQLIAAKMKLKLKEEENLEIGKERDMFKTQTAQLAQERFQLEEKLHVVAAEWKDELAGRLKSLPPGRIWEEMAIKRDDIAILTAERDKREAVLQAEIDRLKAALEEKVLTSKIRPQDAEKTKCDDEIFALAYKDGIKYRYMCYVFEKLRRHATKGEIKNESSIDTTQQLHLVLTYSSKYWSEVSSVNVVV